MQTGGSVSNSFGYLGVVSGSTGTAEISGTWTNANNLSIGNQGNGSLTVRDGGTVNVRSGIGTTSLASGADSAGTLTITGSTAAGILNAASVTAGLGTATLNFNHTDADYHFTTDGAATGTAVAITGSTSVNHLGTGTTTLSGTNTYTSGTTISAGTLAVSANNNLGASDGVINFSGGTLNSTASFTADRATTLGTGGGTLNVDNSTTLTWDGNITGGAGNPLTKTGTGTLILGGTNTYSGDTRVDAGTLRLGAAGALSSNTHLRVQPGAVFDPNGFATALGRLEGDGNVNLGSGNLSLNQAANTTFAGVIAGTGGLAKSGAGRLTLNGTHTFSGDTDVTAGELKLNGSAANSRFNIAGGRLSGSGTVGMLTIANGGTLAPGNSPGTLNAGSTTWESGGNFKWEVNNAAGIVSTNWDLLNITGGLTITATDANPFTVNLVSLTAANATGLVPNFDADANHSWTFVTTTTGITFDGAASIGASFAINASGFQNTLNGIFGLAQNGNDLNVTYTTSAVPEPASFALLFGLFAIGFATTRRTRRAK